MEQLPKKMHDRGISYTLARDCYIPNLSCPTSHSPIGRWGRLHREYLKTYSPVLYQSLLLSGRLHTILADLDEQDTERCHFIIEQMPQAEGITKELKVCEKIIDRLAEKLSKEDYNLVEELQDQASIAQWEENECHFKIGFSAGMLVHQESVGIFKRYVKQTKE